VASKAQCTRPIFFTNFWKQLLETHLSAQFIDQGFHIEECQTIRALPASFFEIAERRQRSIRGQSDPLVSAAVGNASQGGVRSPLPGGTEAAELSNHLFSSVRPSLKQSGWGWRLRFSKGRKPAAWFPKSVRPRPQSP
jgi:hypothetical protein